ncbi:pimeloyl-ACP methyl ester carboxylesterase [Friedmanniella endophytica]|uniref:Pimeloyl-ACP methyl ester carboxylesterase n=1 Tax=Microlunatus kandeliicorticis TaxID=1759536 RepID=A0A7W3P4R0_9ACTN|nr:alpha/beta hydrolase [Microlunatus kandeliicorticis]MBA8793183.1 pimeloyl-ACP methyl ester carboxylesterase [Microlunatus kandeliicorticis]
MARLGGALGLIAGIAALGAGGVAAGFELERRVVSKRIRQDDGDTEEDFFGLRSSGPDLVTPDGVVLHTEIDPADDEADADPDAPSPTIVFVHGYALDLDCWHFQRKHFRGRYRLVLYDQRSHGRSTRSDPELCRIGQLAADLDQVLHEVVPPGPVVLVGHSMGGMTILRLAHTRPELFGPDAPGGRPVVGVGLTFTSSGEMTDYSPIRGLPGRTFNRIAPPLMAGLNRIPELVERSRKAGTDLGYVVTKRMAFGPDPQGRIPVSFVEFVSEMLGGTSLEVVADFYPAFAELDETDGLATLRRLPTAVVGGVDDRILPITHTDRIIESLPGADVLRLEDCGHLGMIEHGPEVNAVLDRLVDRALG